MSDFFKSGATFEPNQTSREIGVSGGKYISESRLMRWGDYYFKNWS